MRSYYIKTVLFGGILLFLMLITQPSDMPVYVFILPFVLFFCFIYNLLSLGIMRNALNKSESDKNFRKKVVFVVSLGLTVFLSLQSIGQLTVRDIVMVLLIGMIGYFYIVRNSKKG